MISPTRKLNIFISSKCGEEDDKYIQTRKVLKETLEQTGLANVYLFEGTGPSILSAEQHYLYSEGGSDLCLFIIDNADDIPPGVQDEIEYAQKHNIRAHFYFCTETSNEKTKLQLSLTGRKFAKTKSISSFKELTENAAQWLIDDIALTYIALCNNQLCDSEKWEKYAAFDLTEDYFRTSLAAPKSVVDNSDKCSHYFGSLFGKNDFKIKKTNALDDWCYQFLEILFERQLITRFNTSMFLAELKNHQSKEYHSTVSKRWEAIQAYFSGDLAACIGKLKEAQKLSEENGLPDWIIKDILVDLRNQETLLNKRNNIIWSNIEAQKQLEESENALYYPLIDRFQKTLYEKYFENIFTKKIKSPFTVTFGHSLEQYTTLLASAYITSMFNGSLTHILRLYKEIERFSFNLCEIFDDWSLRMLLIKFAIIDSSTKEIDGIMRSFPEILIKMNAEEALGIYSFCDNIPISYEKLIARLKVYGLVRYFLDDDSFIKITNDLVGEINSWLNSEQQVVVIGDYIFPALSGVALRIEQDTLAAICYRFLELKLYRFYDEIFKFLSGHVNIDELSESMADRILSALSSFLQDEKSRSRVNNYEKLLCKFRVQDRVRTEHLDKVIQETIPDYYNNVYKLETTQNEAEDFPEFIEKYIGEINAQNSSQGKGGIYYGFGSMPHLTIRSILLNNNCSVDIDMLHDIFRAASETLFSRNQMVSAKCDAISLLIHLCLHRPEIMTHCSDIIEKLKLHKELVQSGEEDFMTQIQEVELQFASMLLYHCFGENVWLQTLGIFPQFSDHIDSQIRVCKIIDMYFESLNTALTDTNLEIFFLQNALLWSAANNLDLRYHAVKLLFYFLRNPDHRGLIGQQLIKSIETDNVYIKSLIIGKTRKNSLLDTETQEYILSRCKTDANYVVRRKAAEFAASLE